MDAGMSDHVWENSEIVALINSTEQAGRMADPSDKLKINLNQNLWIFIVSVAGLGGSEYFHLCSTFQICRIAAWASLASVILTLVFYTINYCRQKWQG